MSLWAWIRAHTDATRLKAGESHFVKREVKIGPLLPKKVPKRA